MSNDLPELPSSSGWSDLPVFRDIGGLVGPSGGPVNWEVARQVAIWVATQGESEPGPDPAEAETLAELARLAELRVLEYSGMPHGANLGQVAVVNRTGWIDGNIPGFRFLLDKLAERMTAAMRAGPDQTNPLEAIIEPMMPIIIGAQIGILLGYMATKVLGQFDILLPRTDGSRIYLVLPNLDALVESYELDREEFYLWVTTHEVAHQVEFAVPWMRKHFTRLIENAITGIEVDPAAISDRLSTIDLTDQESMEKLFGDPTGLLGMMFAPAQADRLVSLQALMSVLEGYAEHVMDKAAAPVVPSVGQMREVLARHRADRSATEKLLERLMGVDLKRQQYSEGEAFCRAVVDTGGLELLNRLWDSRENLPTLEEIRLPQMWQLRVESPG